MERSANKKSGLVREMTPRQCAERAMKCARGWYDMDESPCERCELKDSGGTCAARLTERLAKLVTEAYCDERRIGDKYTMNETGEVYEVVRVMEDWEHYVLKRGSQTIKVTQRALKNGFSRIWKRREIT